MKEGASKEIGKIKDDAIEKGDLPSISDFGRAVPHDKAYSHKPVTAREALIEKEDEVSGHYPEAPPDTQGLTLNDVIQVFRRRYAMVLAGALLGLALVAAGLARTTPIYAVTAKVVIGRQNPGELVDTDSGSAIFIATQAELIGSLSVVARAVATLPRPEHLKPDADAVSAAYSAVQASAIRQTRVIALSYLGPDGNYGAALLRAMVAAYESETRDTARSGQAQVMNTKAAELDALLKEIADQEAQIAELRAINNIIGTADEAAAAQSVLLRDQTEELIGARSRRIELENRLATGGGAGPNVVDRGRDSLQEDLRLVEAELARVSRTLTAEHPTVVAAKSNVEILREQLAASDKAALADQVTEAARYEAELRALVSQSRRRLEAIESHRRAENEWITELARNRTLADTWRNEMSERRLGDQLAEQGNVGVIARFADNPVAPDGPVWPRPKLLLPAGLAFGAIAGFLFGFWSLRRRGAGTGAPDS